MAKKGVCLARCTGELHPGPSGWIHLHSEVLELLLSGERNGVSFMHSGVLFGIFRLSLGDFKLNGFDSIKFESKFPLLLSDFGCNSIQKKL